jgi:hypothetical protein
MATASEYLRPGGPVRDGGMFPVAGGQDRTGMEDDYRTVNRASWEERVTAHAASRITSWSGTLPILISSAVSGPSGQLREEAGSMAGGPVQVSVPECAVAMPGAMARPSPLLPVRRGVPFQRPARRAASRPVRHPHAALRAMSEQK